MSSAFSNSGEMPVSETPLPPTSPTTKDPSSSLSSTTLQMSTSLVVFTVTTTTLVQSWTALLFQSQITLIIRLHITPFFFNNKKKILPLDHSSPNTKTTTPRSPFRVLMLGFHNNKPKSDKKDINYEFQEVVTISSLLNIDNKLDHAQTPSKRFSKDVVNRYLNLIKPLVSRRSNDKVYGSPKEEKQSVFKEVRKHLGKSRSSSSFNAFKPIPSPVMRRDDSALQQQDGIQSAILHCKKSYNSPSQGCNVLSRSGSAPTSQGSRISVDEEKRSSI